jgi:signal transduction histidine kinase/CheY-like chemotaxis protein
LYSIYACAIAIAAFSFYRGPHHPGDYGLFVAFIAISLIIEFNPIAYRHIYAQNISTAILIAAAFIFPPPIVIIIASFAPLFVGIVSKKPLYKTFFNVALQIAVFGVISLLIPGFGLDNLPSPSSTNSLLIILVFAMYVALSTSLTGLLFVLVSEQKLSTLWQEIRNIFNFFDLALLPYGWVLALVWEKSPNVEYLNYFYFTIGLMPLFALHRSFAVHSNLLKEQEATAQLLHQQQQVHEATTVLLSAEDVHVQLDTLLKNLMEVFPLLQASVLVWGEVDESDEIVMRGRSGPSLPIAEWSDKLRHVCEQRSIVHLDEEYITQVTGGRAVLMVPLVTPDDIVGCLVLLSAPRFKWDDENTRLLNTFAAQAAIAIYQARLIASLKSSQVRVVQSERLAAIGTLSAGVAHEFNNLLAGISGVAQLALITNTPEEQETALSTVAQAAQQGSSITRGLLTFARQLEPKRELADIHSAIEPVLLMLQPEFRRANVVVNRNLAYVPPLECDIGMISQVLLNLLTNAIDAMHPNGGDLFLDLYQQDGHVVLAVGDTGSGIPDHVRDKMFEPFVSSKGGSNSKLHGGTGLGLAITYGIITEHGGTITATDREGGGTTMTIRLPLNPAYISPKAAPEPVEPKGPLHMIIVDDEPLIAKTLHGMLTREGHIAQWFTEPTKALEALNHEPVDLIFADLTMPEMDGLTLLSRARQRLPLIKPIVITGHTDPRQLEQVRAAGVLAIIEKPFSLDDVRAVVRNIQIA